MWVSSTFERLDDWIILDTLWHVETNRMTISISSTMTEVIQLIVIDWGFSAKSVLGCKVFIQKGPNTLLDTQDTVRKISPPLSIRNQDAPKLKFDFW